MTEFHAICAMPTLGYLRGIHLSSLIVSADDHISDHCLNGYSSLFSKSSILCAMTRLYARPRSVGV